MNLNKDINLNIDIKSLLQNVKLVISGGVSLIILILIAYIIFTQTSNNTSNVPINQPSGPRFDQVVRFETEGVNFGNSVNEVNDKIQKLNDTMIRVGDIGGKKRINPFEP